jgi:YidC/Oxa1 family membrane protein insertase
MDFQRLLILMGLAVTAYMLILAWNEDYGAGGRLITENPEPVTETRQAPLEVKSPAGDIPAMDDLESDTVTDIVPRLEEPEQSLRRLTTEKSRLVDIKTDVLEVQIDLTGGDITRVALPAYPASLEAPDIPFLLVDPRNKYVAQSGLIGPSGTDSSGSRPLFTTSRYDYDIGSADKLNVTLELTQENGAVILKHFMFRRGDYLIRVEYEIRNLSNEDWRAALFTQIKRDGQQPISFSDNLMGLQPYVGGATRSQDEFYRKLEFDDLEEESYKLVRQQGYMALVQHYFVSASIPKDNEQINYQARKLPGKDVFLFGFTTPAMKLAPGQEGILAAQYYVGPKDQYRMREIAEGLDLTVDYGFLWWLSQPLFYLLTVLYSFFSNWGLAIIGLTVIVKTLLYPLSAASFRSMAKMRKLQPEMARLKERYGDDRQQFSQSMMELYKKEGANPLGGCLPILLQMPVFLALYWTLMESVELRQAPFILWIHDLSAMDPYFVLPILMGISMYLTQLMQPEPPDPIQAKVFKFMPIMFTFFFLWFPSGLVLYWLVNNILSIMQQWYVTRQIEKSG